MCAACNKRHNYNPLPYLNFVVKRYGAEAVAELDSLRMSLQKVTDEDLQRRFEEYRFMV